MIKTECSKCLEGDVPYVHTNKWVHAQLGPSSLLCLTDFKGLYPTYKSNYELQEFLYSKSFFFFEEPWKPKIQVDPRDNWTILTEFVDTHKGQLCLDCSGNLVILDSLEDGEEDYYYVVRSLNGGHIEKQSCVGWMIPLKGKLEDRAYEFLMGMFMLNWKWRKPVEPNPQADKLLANIWRQEDDPGSST